jgi:hypothetical protein
MTSKMTRRATLVGLTMLAATRGRAQTTKSKPAEGRLLATLEKPAAFEIQQKSGGLRETVQKQQELIWRLKDNSEEAAFQLSNISVGLIRNETGSQVKMSFSCHVTSSGYSSVAKLNVVARSKGGAALHSWSLEVPIACGDTPQTPTPQTEDLPDDIAVNIFTNASTVEISEATERGSASTNLQRCGRS